MILTSNYYLCFLGVHCRCAASISLFAVPFIKAQLSPFAILCFAVFFPFPRASIIFPSCLQVPHSSELAGSPHCAHSIIASALPFCISTSIGLRFLNDAIIPCLVPGCELSSSFRSLRYWLRFAIHE